MNFRNGCLLSLLALLAACDRAPAGESPKQMAVKDSSEVAPALIAPSEVADPTLPPSYEVAIAGAAATRNKALERCAQQPEIVRPQCEQEANAAFVESETSLQDLRGNQQ
jgi:uncharacterized lipoprotein